MSQKPKARSTDSKLRPGQSGSVHSRSRTTGVDDRGKPSGQRTAETGKHTKREATHLHKSKHLASAQSDHALDFGYPDDSTALTKSAAVSRLERELADAKKENTALRKELTEIRSMHEQLIHELPEEMFPEKRVNLLKSQIFQLERQVLLMSQALGTRGELLVDLFSMLEWMEERERSSSQSSNEVLQRIATLKLRLSKFMQNGTVEKLAIPVQFLDAFVKPKRPTLRAGSEEDTTVTLVDVCRASTLDNFNLKHVSRLESKLAQLYGQLVQLKSSLQTAPASISRTGHLFQPIREHCCDHVTKSCKLIGECCHDLLCLSLLVPTAPWPPLRGKEVSPAISVDDILKNMPSSARTKKEVKESVQAAVVALNYSADMHDEKCRSVEKELKFHSAVYKLQVDYVDSLFKAVRCGYEEFESSLQELVCSPVETLLAKFDSLAQTTDEEALREFLSCFKQSYPELKDVVRRMRQSKEDGRPSEGTEVLSLFGKQFFRELHELEQDRFKQTQDQATSSASSTS